LKKGVREYDPGRNPVRLWKILKESGRMLLIGSWPEGQKLA